MQYLKISVGIFIALAASRFIPHPPNFTSLLALSFYVPALLGIRFLPALVLSFLVTDIFIGFHSITPFVYISIIGISCIGYFSKKINNVAILKSSLLFFSISNLGVWFLGYPNTLAGFISCYTFALPFLINTILGDFFFYHALNLSFNKIEERYPSLAS